METHLLKDLVLKWIDDLESTRFTARDIAQFLGEGEARILEYLHAFRKRGLLTSTQIWPAKITRKRRPYEVFCPDRERVKAALRAEATHA